MYLWTKYDHKTSIHTYIKPSFSPFNIYTRLYSKQLDEKLCVQRATSCVRKRILCHKLGTRSLIRETEPKKKKENEKKKRKEKKKKK